MKYFISVQEWAKNQNIEVFYFSSFDESWKVKQEGEVGAAWVFGIRMKKLKFQKKNRSSYREGRYWEASKFDVENKEHEAVSINVVDYTNKSPDELGELFEKFSIME
jgi:hypothetical protein